MEFTALFLAILITMLVAWRGDALAADSARVDVRGDVFAAASTAPHYDPLFPGDLQLPSPRAPLSSVGSGVGLAASA